MFLQQTTKSLLRTHHHPPTYLSNSRYFPREKPVSFFYPSSYTLPTLSLRACYTNWRSVRSVSRCSFFLSGTEASPHQDNNVETPSTDNIVPNRKYTSASCFHPFLAQRFDLSNSNLCSKIDARRCLALNPLAFAQTTF